MSNRVQPPPPPPLPPSARHFAGAAPQVVRIGGPPQPNIRPPVQPVQQPQQQPQQQQPPQQQQQIRQVNSTRYVDLTPRAPLDEDACRKKLTTYDATSIRKVTPLDVKKDKPTWAKTEHTKEALSQEEMAKHIKKLNEGDSVTEKKQKLRPFQQKQVSRVIDALKTVEHDNNFDWSLVQIDQKFQPVGKKKETTVITVYAKRAPRSDINALHLFNSIENMKNRERERAAQMAQAAEAAQAAQAFQAAQMAPMNRPPMPRGADQNGARIASIPRRKGRRYHDDTSTYSGFTSETESDLDYSSSDNTSISSRSGRRSRRYHRDRRSRSHSRHREHRRDYHHDAPASPSYPRFPLAPYAPEVPRTSTEDIRVAAAYHAGKIDGDAERYGYPERFPLTRGRPLLTTGLGERYPLVDRFAEERYEAELRLREEDRLRRRELDMERRVQEQARLVNNPFVPRRYAPSEDDYYH